MNEKKYVTLAEAEKIMNLSIQTIRKKLKAGEIPYSQPSKKYLIALEDIYFWIEKNKKN